MKEAIPNAASLTLRTLIPAAAAARSFERTASIRCPRSERRRFATSKPERERDGEHEEAEHRARHLPVETTERSVRAEIEAEDLRLRHRRARAASAPCRVQEDELLDRDGRGERDDGEADAADAQRADGDDEPADRRADRADQHRPRKADAVIRGEVGEDEPRDPGERELDDRDLADVAGDHDEREAHDGRQQRRDQRLPEVVGQHDQRDGRGRRRDQRGVATAGVARGASGSRCSISSPRLGRLVPRTNMATTISPKTRSGCTPGSATPWSVGNQLKVWR